MAYEVEDLKKFLEEDFLCNEDAFKDRHKNDDAVDLSIICHCLGEAYDIVSIVDVMADRFHWNKYRYDEAMEHIERVRPYLNRWGKSGTMDAMVYCINH